MRPHRPPRPGRHAAGRGRTGGELHPAAVRLIVVLAVWFLASIWLFFGGPPETDDLLAVVTGFVCVATGLTLLARSAGRRFGEDEGPPAKSTIFGDRLHGDFESATGRDRSATTLVEILIPLAAVAFGATAIGLAFLVASSS